MSRIADTHNYKGFIRDIFANAQKSLDAEKIKNFTNLCDNEARYSFVSNFKCVKEFQGARIKATVKDLKISQLFKRKGNEAFQQKKWMTAVDFYNQSLLVLPSENDVDFAILLANRSAALYHLEKFDHALSDIRMAEKNYPKEMLHKLKERSARCYLAKKDFEPALKSFKETITNLDNSKLPMEKRGKLEKDAQIMIKMLPQQIEAEKKLKLKQSCKSVSKKPVMNKLSDAVTFDYNEREGRFAKANRDIRVGEQILCHEAHCATLMETFSKSHCQNCFKRTITPLPCPNCIDVVFCSEKCLAEASATYHRFECGLLETIWGSGSSINCHMALRIISRKPLSYFKNLRNELTDDLTADKVQNLSNSDYRFVYSLVRNEEAREFHSFFQYAFMATFLIDLLQANHYFDDENSGSAKNDINFIGGLLLRNLQILQFNSHEIFDLLKTKRNDVTQTVPIGAGLYPTLALFNHSCNPSIIRYFKGTSVYAVAIHNVKAGQMISENYGPLYSQNSKLERQEKLKKFYWFDCNCEACEENWPVFADMVTNEIRFKCDGSKSCNNIITIPTDCNEFMIQCNKCGEFTNILKGLKAVQDTVILEKSGKNLFNEGNIDKALQKYLEMMSILDDVMAPPFQDYCKCQQAIKNCLLEYGNRIQVD